MIHSQKKYEYEVTGAGFGYMEVLVGTNIAISLDITLLHV